MNEVKNKIESFTDLHTWQEGHKFVVQIYEMAKTLPATEVYGLKSQMQRAAISITSNIAEGFSRSSFADKLHFYHMSKGSLTELQNQLLIARDVGYSPGNLFDDLATQSKSVQRLLIGLIRSTRANDKRKQ